MNVTKDSTINIFFKYSIPAIFGMLAVSSANIIDGFFIGNYVGDVGLAAVNITFPVFSLLFGFSLMLAVGSSVTTGKFLGEENINLASTIFTKTLVAVSLLSFFISFIIWLNIDTILRLFGANESLLIFAKEYLTIILLFVPFLMIGIVLDYFVRVDNRPNLAFIAMFSSALVNAVLDYYFIVVLQKGLFGAALATGISWLFLIIVLLPHVFSKKASLKFVKPSGSYKDILKAAYNGASEFANELSIGVTTLIANYVVIKNFQVEGLAAFAVIEYALIIGIMISFAISDSLGPIISKNFGAKKDDRIKEFLKLAFISTTFVGLFMIALLLLAPSTLAELFLDDSSVRAKELILYFSMFIWAVFIFDGPNMVISSYLTSVHKPLASMVVALSRSFVLPVLFLLTLPIFFGTTGILISAPLAEAITFIIALVLFKKFSPKNVIKKRIKIKE